MFDTMRHIRPDVSTVCVGLAASMGAFLLASGHQGKRYSLPNSRIMIHQPLGGAQGQAADIEIQVRAGGAAWLVLLVGVVIERRQHGWRRPCCLWLRLVLAGAGWWRSWLVLAMLVVAAGCG